MWHGNSVSVLLTVYHIAPAGKYYRYNICVHCCLLVTIGHEWSRTDRLWVGSTRVLLSFFKPTSILFLSEICNLYGVVKRALLLQLNDKLLTERFHCPEFQSYYAKFPINLPVLFPRHAIRPSNETLHCDCRFLPLCIVLLSTIN